MRCRIRRVDRLISGLFQSRRMALACCLSLFLVSTQAAAQGYNLWSQPLDATAVANAGDVNRDGFDDVVSVGRYGNNQGQVMVVSGVDGTLLHHIRGTTGSGFMGSVDGVGDLDGDKYDDFIAGKVPGATVYSGRTGNVLLQLTSNGLPRERFGFRVRGVGDVNRDGTPDVAVTALYTGGPSTSGYTKVFSGRNGARLYTFTGLGFGIGAGLDGAGDVNRDGYDDILVGEYKGPGRGGNVRIFSGKDGTVIRMLQGHPTIEELFGQNVANAGDVNGDGYPDQFISAQNATVGTMYLAGQARLFSGKDGTLLRTFSGQIDDSFGMSLAAGGDVDGDGIPDLVAGSTEAAIFYPGNGYIDVYSGANGSLIFRIKGSGYRSLGGIVCMGGNMDGDQTHEVVIKGSTANHSGTLAFSAIPPATLALAGQPKINTTVHVQLMSPGDAGLQYAAGFAIGDQPGITLPDTRVIPLNNDWLLAFSLTPNNGMFFNTVNTLATTGTAAVQITIPNLQLLVGQTVYGAWAVLDPRSPLGFRRISNSLAIQFQ